MLVHYVVGSVSEIDNVLVVVDVTVLVMVIAGLEVNAKNLHSPCKSFITAFLLTSPVKFLLIPTLLVYRHSSYLRRVHMIEAIVLNGFVIEPGAVASFPLQTTNHAKFCAATASHVVTALLQFNSGGAIETALPAFLLGDFGETLRGFVLGAFATRMPFAIASAAHFCSTAATFPIFAASVGATRGIEVDVCRFDPFTTSSCRAVDAILGSVLLVFLIPFHLEFCIEKFLDVFQRDVVLSAAFRRHMLRISNR